MEKTSRLILKVHSVFLIILTLALTAAGFVGLNSGVGPFAWLRDIPMTMVGLMQAYLLMLLIGVTLWIGSNGDRTWRWSLLAIAAHLIPLLAIFSLWGVLADGGYLGMANVSYVIHGVWIAIETFSIVTATRPRAAAVLAA